MTEYIVRFLVGGAVVSAFAMLGDVLRPKSFAAFSARRPPWRSPRLASRFTRKARPTLWYRAAP